ncbi:UDP-N-acetylmuramate dehydrogenase [Planococcus glaciei]|uniref:UDP-N-acetylenolpyruvoylglucosamine reductase n=1 Tax=Planococcus glaciei TaxID=459472 RepID=A0A1G7Z605_9BACL|nr:UDP-N-acetylmuramate dehydrogenase [Planococcus glaciei]ETP68474.1 UDP-N-acetylenolpyruvoylglucosamine reductase [Planococcus glaciei CHR43]MBX0316522.1 UDP-N-acetylmuramate dehydrogenase [Planococcus glaciei]QDY45636.1 UDP-N-acetylmuramate dehydrogenase [Planococcus glaciei]QKX50814.1 UDP-N-acetylmuramate dehydrogenase [Planococcus glaciei]SDH04182.1 UDP-N-acetylmuramate dehydrogenase [Planococcus glaciei]
MTKEQWLSDLRRFLADDHVKMDEPLHLHTLTRMGGPADIFVTPTTEDETAYAVKYAYENKIPLLLLGNGSNMVVRDGGVRGIVLNLKSLRTVRIEGTSVYAQGGANIKEVSKIAAANRLTGFEFACGIPGSIGGAMAMNAGAYGGEIKDIIRQATVLTREGEKLVLSKEDLELGYRKSIIIKKGYYVLSAEFSLEFGKQAAIDAKMSDLTIQRETKQPLEFPSAGSVFKRPPGNFAGKLIQESGLQGKGFGGAEVSTKHAGFIVNKNNATANDYIQTIEMVKTAVFEKFGIDLELEVKIVGEDSI